MSSLSCFESALLSGDMLKYALAVQELKTSKLVNFQDQKDFTPMHYVIHWGERVHAETLDSVDLDYTLRTGEEGKTLLMVACIVGNLSVAEFLIEKSKNVNEVDYSGRTAAHYAARHILHGLLEKGASLQICDVSGYKPLDTPKAKSRVPAYIK